MTAASTLAARSTACESAAEREGTAKPCGSGGEQQRRESFFPWQEITNMQPAAADDNRNAVAL